MPEATKTPAGAPKVFVALDFPNRAPAMELIRKLKDLPVHYKIGLELFIVGGPDLVREVARTGREIFLDLKLHDIPNTVSKAALAAAQLGVHYLTLHAAGGEAMFRATHNELQVVPAAQRPRLLAVSVLTSFDTPGWQTVTQALGAQASDPAESVERLAALAATWRADGLICSPQELARVRKVAPKLELIVPGIRPAGAPAGDQARVLTPAEARAQGAAGLVVGRPITQAVDPKRAAESILAELGKS